MANIKPELSFVVRNLETGEDSRWIELHNMEEDMVRSIWNSVTDPQHDFEIVDLESNFSLDYYEFQYAPLEALMQAFKILESNCRFDDECLIMEAELQRGSSILDLDGELDGLVLFVDSESDLDLALAYIEMADLYLPNLADRYFDFESFGRDLQFSGFITDMEEENPELAEDLGMMREDELGEWYVENFYGDVEQLPEEEIERHFEHESFGRDLSMEFDYVELGGLQAQVKLD